MNNNTVFTVNFQYIAFGFLSSANNRGMVVLRVTLLALVLFTGYGSVFAQKSNRTIPSVDYIYWENQTPSQKRDSILLQLYANKSHVTADPDSAMAWLQKGFKIALQARSSTGLAFIHNRMGLAYLRNGVSFQAIEYFFKGLQYAEIAKNSSEQAFSWDYIGDCYASLKNYNQAIAAENRAVKLHRLHGNILGMAASLNDLGAVLSAHQQLPAAISALEKSLILNQDLNNLELRTDTYLTLAATLLNKGDFNQAYSHANLALANQIETRGRPTAELLALMSLIEAHRNNTDHALTYADRAELYMSLEWPPMQEKVAFTLFETYKFLKKPSLALLWHEKYVTLHESVNLVAQEKRIEVLRYEYDAKQRDDQMQLMADNMARESYLRWILISASAIFLLLAAALYRSNLLMRKHRKQLDATNGQLVYVGQLLQQTNATLEDRVAARTNELREANRSLTLKNSEIQEALFRGQSLERKRVASELHNNLGSLLSAIRWRLESVETDTLSPSEQTLHRGVVRLITDAYNQVRHISHNLLPSILEKEGLIPALEKLVAEVNQPGKLTFELVVSKDVLIDDEKVAFELYSCVLELITNIIKHAEAQKVVLQIVQTEGSHTLMITDDGVGINEPPAGARGQGLDNIRQRVKSLNGNFSIRTLKNKRGTVVALRIPHQASLVS